MRKQKPVIYGRSFVIWFHRIYPATNQASDLGKKPNPLRLMVYMLNSHITFYSVPVLVLKLPKKGWHFLGVINPILGFVVADPKLSGPA